MNKNAPAFYPSYILQQNNGQPPEEERAATEEVNKALEEKAHKDQDDVKESWDAPDGAQEGESGEAAEAPAGDEAVEGESGAKVEAHAEDAKVDMTADKLAKTTVDDRHADEDGEDAEGDAEEGQEDDIIPNFEGSGDGKKHVNVVFIGHVDAGKSTMAGCILWVTGNIDERTMERYEREAKQLSRESWKYAYALDTTEQERSKGKTEECGRATFVTATKKWTILDAPGHKNFVPHMIGGTSQADVAILVISARRGEFETGFEKGGQTREHAMLAKTCGVRSLLVAINKMDDTTIITPDGQWSEERFNECRTKLTPFLKQVGWKPGDLVWLPVSGFTECNIKDKVPESVCPWYKGESLLDTLENLSPPERLLNAPVRMPVFEKFKEMSIFIMGKVESGVLRVGTKYILMPAKSTVNVEDIQLETGDNLKTAEPGDNVRLKIKGIEEENIKVGSVLCSEDSPILAATQFEVQLMILEHKSIITAGYSAVMHVNATVVECCIDRLLGVVDKKTGQVASKNVRFAKPGMTVIARMSAAQPICISTFDEFSPLGRFMIRDEGRTIGAGKITRIRRSKSSGN
mmetsp:Transcript_6073/g.18351  ORF Transcript_6073/g.18351 Transcript_6073/m.18351 type:complete len:577 (+) Transcript_6073:186-1916(+)|eukprot:CAMPEP_0198736986 /NCGR_PEP_ID=MMETSP1475-20131203/67635_1 /TAXON_ID= ORGANISM="Unidentified sp., Strain CCMP1999" /NCGR_SAMPLE_ID=MMETSP1475 /ASSEMBLY_ACC=CAM_ASM_001111 /LENGTH=576 /DNA_ID=CAMNT_0044500841 /DNA_START=136 /DNA_END=1866 /DNA_ORIENTATION=+